MVRTKTRRTIRGFTLTELMIVVAVLGVVGTMGSSLIKNMIKFNRLNTARLDTQRGARDSLSQINRNLRQAKASTIVVSQEAGQPPYSALYFDSVDNRVMKYYQQDKKLYVVSNGSTSTLADNLRTIAFAFPRTDDPGILSVSVTFEKETYEGSSKALQMAIEKVRVMND
jgi:prepilin-type N-terminal cleavage/methylation domain-containing protein